MDKCCPRVDVVSTHWEGCHEHHPECAAYQSGYEAGLRRAAEALKARDELAYRNIKDFAAQENVALDENEYLLGRGDEAHGAYRAILAEIKGE